MKHIIRLLLLTCLGLLAVACGSPTQTVEEESRPAAEPTATLSLPPTATAAPAADPSALPEPFDQVGNNGSVQFLNSFATW